MTNSIADVGARLVLTGRAEFLGTLKDAQKALVDTGKAAKDSGAAMTSAAGGSDKLSAAQKKVAATSTAAAGGADKLAAAQKRVAVTQKELAAATREYEASMQVVMPEGAAAVASADRQVAALDRLKAAEVEAGAAAKDSAKVQAESAAAAADAQKKSADEQVAANDRTGASAKSKGIMSSKAVFGIAAAGAALGYESIKLAAGFETQMTRLTTAANMPKPIVDANRDAIMKMGEQAGFTGTQVAEALYHPISAGLDMASSMAVVRDSMKEARISGASLDDTTYALSGVMKAFNIDAAGSTQTMSTLNAIVGQGDMHFQDFNESVKGWAAPAATFGVSIQSVGAALAYMTDRQVPAAQAGTQLGMTMALMAAPTKQATKILTDAGMGADEAGQKTSAMTDVLKKAGVTTTQMSADMKKPDGLMVALQDLKTHMTNAGVSADEQAAVITRAFGGGKSGKAIMSMYQNLDGLKQKYDSIGDDATPTKFEEAFGLAAKTTEGRLATLKSSFADFGIKIGTALLPYVDKAIAGFSKFFGFLSSNHTAMMVFAGVVGVLLVSAFVALGISVIAATWPIILVVAAIAGLAAGFMYLWNHVEGFRNFWKAAWKDISGWVSTAWGAIKYIFEDIQSGWNALKYTFSTGASTSGLSGIIGAMAKVGVAARQVVDWVKAHWPEIKSIASEVWHDVYAVVSTVIKDSIIVIGAIVTWIRDHWSEIKIIAKTTWDVVSAIVVTAVKVIYDVVTSVVGWIRDHWSEIKSVTKVIWDVVSTIVKDAIIVIIDIVKGIIAAVDWVIRTWQSISDSTAKFLAPLVEFVRAHWDEIKQVTEFAWNVIYTTVQVAWTQISVVFSVVWGVIKGIFDAFLPLIVGLLDVAWQTIKSAVHIAWDLIVGILRTAWDIIAGVFTTARDLVLGIISVLLDVLTGHWHQAWDDIWHYTGAVLNDVVDSIKNPLGDMLNTVKNILMDLYHAFGDISQSIWDTVSNTFKGGINGVLDLVNGFLGAINTVAGAVGLNLNLHVDPIGSGGGGAPPPASAPLASTGLRTGSSTAGLAAGGLLHGPGTGTSDSILGMDYFTGMPTAYVSNGEFVVKEKSYRKYPAEVEAINAGTFPKLAVGGPIPGLAGGGTTWPAMFSVIKGQFPDALDNSDFRPGDPGYHGRGQALDVGFAGDNNAKLTEASQWIASKYGGETAELIHQTGRNIKDNQDVGDGYGLYGASTMDAHLNHTHWAMDHDPGGGGKGLLGTLMGAFSSAVSAIRHIAAGALDAAWPTMPVPQNMMGLLPATANKLRDGVISFVNGQDQARGGGDAGGGNYTGPIPGGDAVGRWRGLVDSTLTELGMPTSLDDKVLRQIATESSGNPNAIQGAIGDVNNASGDLARGLMQVIGTTFHRYAGPYDALGQYDPHASIYAGLNYARATYGPDLSFLGQGHGYKWGGIVGMDPQTAFEHRFMGGPVNSGQPYVVGERGPEVFVPAVSGQIIPAADKSAAVGRTAGSPLGGFGATVNVAAGAIVIHESRDPHATYQAVRQGLADAVARQ